MNRKILIIDDDQVDLKVMKKSLQRAGFPDVVVATTGESGVEAARREAPAVVIVDTLLPGIDGHKTCQQLKELPLEGLKVIVTTGAVDAVNAREARTAGADDYVVKTVDYAHLVAAVETILRGQ